MRSQHFPMSKGAFDRMPRKLGWKHEYWDGQAHISPRWQSVTVTLAVQPRPVHASYTIRAVTAEDEPQLVTGYIAAFEDSFDFCDWELAKIHTAAREDVRKMLSGQRGRLLPASCLALDPHAATREEQLIGAALITHSDGHLPLLDIVFVVPQWHRRGVATTLLATVSNAMHAAGMPTLESHYMLGNAESRAWHQHFGFVEEPDLLLAKTYYHHAHYELHRREDLGDLLVSEREKLRAERDHWQARVDELEQLAHQLGMDAVMPSLRRP